MFKLRDLPFKKGDLGSFLSEKTLEFHYGKHHQTYVNNLNNLIKDGEFAKKSLYEIILHSSGGIFNNAAQVYNHDFYWDCLSPNESSIPSDLEDDLKKELGADFKEKFLNAATTLFGSGWCWIALNTASNKLEIIQTSNAATPISDKKVPILVVDVWEHAYYIDHKNARPAYLESFWKHINWDFVKEALKWARLEKMGSVEHHINKIHSKD